MTELEWRCAIVDEARTWLGTPYQHQASIKQVGCDCLGLLRGVWRQLLGAEPEAMPAYGPRWNESSETDLLVAMAERNFTAIAAHAELNLGDILLFKYRLDLPTRHLAIVTSDAKFIHAYVGRGVVENSFSPWWKRHLSHRYRWQNKNLK